MLHAGLSLFQEKNGGRQVLIRKHSIRFLFVRGVGSPMGACRTPGWLVIGNVHGDLTKDGLPIVLVHGGGIPTGRRRICILLIAFMPL
jgi:hypothetical protein